MKIKVTKTHHNKMKNTDTWTLTNRQHKTTDLYQPIPPKDTSDIARGMGLLKPK